MPIIGHVYRIRSQPEFAASHPVARELPRGWQGPEAHLVQSLRLAHGHHRGLTASWWSASVWRSVARSAAWLGAGGAIGAGATGSICRWSISGGYDTGSETCDGSVGRLFTATLVASKACAWLQRLSAISRGFPEPAGPG